MASQRVLLFTIGGVLADNIWKGICRWSDGRTTSSVAEWSPEDWPPNVRAEVDAFVAKLTKAAYTPPILYRSEHVDCWSMGDVYQEALVKGHPDFCRQLLTSSHHIIATWVRYSERIIPDDDAADETRWLHSRINEAIAAWAQFAENRLVILVRSAFDALCTDEEVEEALRSIPSWWKNID